MKSMHRLEVPTLKILVQGQTVVRHDFLSPLFLCAHFCALCLLVVSLCQFDSPVLLWTGCDNGALPAICNPPVDCLHQIMHYNHNLTNLLGVPIDKIQRMKFALLTAQLVSAPQDSSFPLVSPGNPPTITDGTEQEIMHMMKTNEKNK